MFNPPFYRQDVYFQKFLLSAHLHYIMNPRGEIHASRTTGLGSTSSETVNPFYPLIQKLAYCSPMLYMEPLCKISMV